MTLETVEEKVDKILEQFTEVLELDPDMFPNMSQTYVFPTTGNIQGFRIEARVEDRGFEGKFFVIILTYGGYVHLATRRWKLIRA